MKKFLKKKKLIIGFVIGLVVLVGGVAILKIWDGPALVFYCGNMMDMIF